MMTAAFSVGSFRSGVVSNDERVVELDRAATEIEHTGAGIADDQSFFLAGQQVSDLENPPAHIDLGVGVRGVAGQRNISTAEMQVSSTRDGYVTLIIGLNGDTHATLDVDDATGEIRVGSILVAEPPEPLPSVIARWS